MSEQYWKEHICEVCKFGQMEDSSKCKDCSFELPTNYKPNEITIIDHGKYVEIVEDD